MDDNERRAILRVLYATIFLTSTGLGTCTFLLPVYAETIGATYTQLGLIGAVGNLVYTVITIVAGGALDRYEKIKLYTIFTVLGAVSMILFSFAETIPEVIAVRALLGAASASFWVGASTLTGVISPREEITRSLGRYNMAWILGFTVGPYLGGLISTRYGYGVFFISLGGVIAVSIGLILSSIRGKITLNQSIEHEDASLSELKPLLMSYVTLIPFTMVLGIYMAIIPGHMKTVGLSASLIGLLITMTNGTRGCVFFNVERLVEWGTWKSLLTASTLLAAAMFMVRKANTGVGFAVPLVLYGLGSGIMTPVTLDFISKRTPERLRGTAMGVHEGIYGIGMCLGPLLGGAFADIYGAAMLYTVLVFVSLLILPLGYRMTHESSV